MAFIGFGTNHPCAHLDPFHLSSLEWLMENAISHIDCFHFIESHQLIFTSLSPNYTDIGMVPIRDHRSSDLLVNFIT